jgi:hypothetical protein
MGLGRLSFVMAEQNTWRIAPDKAAFVRRQYYDLSLQLTGYRASEGFQI